MTVTCCWAVMCNRRLSPLTLSHVSTHPLGTDENTRCSLFAKRGIQPSLNEYHPEFLQHESAWSESTLPSFWVSWLLFKEISLKAVSFLALSPEEVSIREWESSFAFIWLNWLKSPSHGSRWSHYRHFHLILSLSAWCRAQPLTDPALSEEGFFGLSRSATRNPLKSQNEMHPAFYSIPALPLSWFNTVALIYAPRLLSTGC